MDDYHAENARAKKFLGQHFLTDLTVAQRIAETLTSGRTIEIGPGMGVLTQYLLKNPNIHLTAIEIDRESVAYLREWYPELDLVEGDFLKLDLDQLIPEGEFNVIGNYPYNISSQIFFKVLDYKDRIPVCSGMIQKVIRMTRNKRRRLDCDEALFKTIVKTAFNQRRKQMRNSLKGVMGEGLPVTGNERLEWFLTRRPEQLSVDEFIELTTLISNL